jgi:hypothetical protein
VGGHDDADRAVHDRLHRTLVEKRLHEGERCPDHRESPQDERSVECGRRPQLALEGELAAREKPCLLAQETKRVGARTLVEEQLEHELRAEVADVLDRRVAPLPEGRAAASRGGERRSRGTLVARRRSLLLDEPASRNCPSARYTRGLVHE